MGRGEDRAPARTIPRRGLGLSWKLLLLTALFVALSEILIYVPSVANFRRNWLDNRLNLANAASLVLASSDAAVVPRDIQDQLLNAVGAIAAGISWAVSNGRAVKKDDGDALVFSGRVLAFHVAGATLTLLFAALITARV